MLLSFPSPLSPDPIRLSLRSGSSTLALGMNHVVWFDSAGRLLTAYRDGRLYKRGLDHRVITKWRPWTIGRPEYIRQDLTDEEKRHLAEEVQATIQQVLAGLSAGAPPAFRARLMQAARSDTQAYAEDRC